MAVLKVENLSKSFNNQQVLKNISFELEKGEVLAIIGSSGGGKTTLLRCLNQLIKPDEGKIIVNDDVMFDASLGKKNDVDMRRKRLHFGLVFQQFNLFPQYNVFNNLTLAARLLAKENNKGKKKADLKIAYDEKLGVEIIRRAVEEPLRQIVENAGLEGSVIVNEVRNGKGDYGYNARTEKFENLFATGVIDPAKVTRVALENAASIAGMLLTTECVLCDIKEETPAAPAMNPGMGGMY